jgi:raffinose/stachyose/melibiose transport system substrate-binding protein
MNMKKKLFIPLAMTLSFTMLAACGTSTTSDATSSPTTAAKETAAPAATTAANANIKGKITYITHRTDLVDTKFKEYADAFKKKYPAVEAVEFEAIKDYEGTMKVRLSTGEIGDVSVIPGGGVSNGQLKDYYVPLDDLGLTDKIYFPDVRSDGGHIYGIPSGVSTDGIVYNKQAFAKAGITAVPKTLDEFYADAEKLKAVGIVPLASNFKDKWPLAEWDTLAQVISGDADFRTNMAKVDDPFSDDKPYGKSLAIIKALITKGDVEKDLMSTDWESSKKDVASGKTAMYFLGNWVINQVIETGAKKEDIGFFPFPYDNSGKYNVNLGGDYNYAVSNKSKNIETAKAFVKFLVEETDYADYSGFINPIKSKKSTMPQLAEFMATNPVTVEGKPQSDEYTTIGNKSKIDFYSGTYIQNLMLNKDYKAGIADLNKKWADAKKSLAK